MPKWFCPNMAVNEAIDIPWVGPIGLMTVDGKRVSIPEPSAHTGVRPVRIRILSAANREGLNASFLSGVGSCQPRSPYLLMHCHGGGFVATSSKSHEASVIISVRKKHLAFVDISSSVGKITRLYISFSGLFACTRESISSTNRRGAICLCMGDNESE